MLEILGVNEETTGSSNSGEGNSGGSGSHGQGGSADGTGGHQGQGRNIIFTSICYCQSQIRRRIKNSKPIDAIFQYHQSKNMREPLHDRSTIANIGGSYHHQQASDTRKSESKNEFDVYILPLSQALTSPFVQ